MSEPKNFLQRWSQRKLAKGDEATPQREEPPQGERQNQQPAPQGQSHPVAGREDQPFDLSSLPSIESIDANTDVTAFLRPGVPSELSRAALRRAWSADPAIRDFVGLVENGWDFNDPNAMAGFGPIEPAEVARLAGQLLDGLSSSPTGAPVESAKSGAFSDVDKRNSAEFASAPDQEDAAAPATPDTHRSTQSIATHKDATD